MSVKMEVHPWPFVLFAVLAVLKLTGVVSWSWWWIFSPLLLVAFFFTCGLVLSALIMSWKR